MKNYSSEDMIRFLYREMTIAEAADFQQQLDSNFELKEALEAFQQTLTNLDTLHFSPRPKVLERLLRYAEATKPVEH